MATGAKKDLDRLMGNNLKRLRRERGWSQEHLAELIDSDRRYISAIENGRGIGSAVLTKLCAVFQVGEERFALMTAAENGEIYGKLPEVTRMILEELQSLPEYEQLRILADLKEKRAKG
jgi:putative transcriptional regulator